MKVSELLMNQGFTHLRKHSSCFTFRAERLLLVRIIDSSLTRSAFVLKKMILCNKFLHKIQNSVFDNIIILKAIFARFTDDWVLFHNIDAFAVEAFETQNILQLGFNNFIIFIHDFFLFISRFIDNPFGRI